MAKPFGTFRRVEASSTGGRGRLLAAGDDAEVAVKAGFIGATAAVPDDWTGIRVGVATTTTGRVWVEGAALAVWANVAVWSEVDPVGPGSGLQATNRNKIDTARVKRRGMENELFIQSLSYF
jgi:hypothetical protein